MKLQRTLSPAAAPLKARDLLRGLTASASIEGLTRELQEYFGLENIFLVNSGKAALTLILAGLKRLSNRKKVVIPAYTCFSVPSAVVKAGLQVELCDVDPYNLDLDFVALKRALDDDVLAVIPTHLMGYYADVKHVRNETRDRNIVVIEDVAQAFGGIHEGKPLGTVGDVAFLSFGRGKNITCGSGGVILTNSNEIACAIRAEYDFTMHEPPAGALRNWFEVALMQMLISPLSYWLPAGLPFLKLGETKFYKDFPIYCMDVRRMGLLSSWKERLAESTACRNKVAAELTRRLQDSGMGPTQPRPRYGSTNLRFPLLLNTHQEKRSLCALSQERGLGLSACYPTTIQRIPELGLNWSGPSYPGATILAERLVTLPTHQYVTPYDRDRIVASVAEVVRSSSDSTVL